MGAWNLSYPSLAGRPIKGSMASSTAAAPAEPAAEKGSFAKLLAAAGTETESPSKPGLSADELLKKLEDAVKAMEELLNEDGLPLEQHELLGAVLQILSLPAKQLESEAVSFVNMPETAGISATADESEAPLTPVQQKAGDLVRQIAQKLQELPSGPDKEFGNSPIFLGVEKEYSLYDIKKMESAIGQAAILLEDFAAHQESSDKQMSAKLVEQVELLLEKTALLIQELERDAPLQEVPEIQLEDHLVKGKADETSKDLFHQHESGSEAQPGAPLEGTKPLQSNQAAARTEGAPPAVRLSNVAEDLSGVLRNSIRMNGAGENAQIRVSIFPEHLGHLEIRLNTVDGKVAAQIFTTSIAAKEALDFQVNQLRASLVQQGIAVDRIEISQQQPGQSFGQPHAHQEQRFSQQQRQGTGSSPSKNGYQRMEEEKTVVRSHSADGTKMTVDYTI